MPTFNYKCNKCETKFEVFHKVKEDQSIITCPECNSVDYKKLISAPNIGLHSSSSTSNNIPQAPCATGACQSGLCNLN